MDHGCNDHFIKLNITNADTYHQETNLLGANKKWIKHETNPTKENLIKN